MTFPDPGPAQTETPVFPDIARLTTLAHSARFIAAARPPAGRPAGVNAPLARRTVSRAVVASVLLAAGVAAHEARAQGLPGYHSANAAAQRRLEAAAAAGPTPDSAAAHSRVLTREPHVAGTPAQARTRDYVIQRMRDWGLETEVRAYEVWMPHPTTIRVWRVAPDPRELPLVEGPVVGDSTSRLPEVLPINGYGGTGDVTAEVVYVNYGLIEDYATLDSLGVSVRGKVAIARYGRSFRGIKVREAERHGAVALIMYSDPQDDGYVRGDVYPTGPMRPPSGIQRGSVFNGSGDPTTPGTPSVRGARRLDPATTGAPRIPVVPISYGNAAELLRGLHGTDVPQTWQGGLPFRYHIGPGPVEARVVVSTDTATAPYKTIWNTFGVIRGTEFPDELVVIGAHRDAWGPGAGDNVSGTTSVLEAARVVGDLARRGTRPKRTVVFATWDAEEWGLIGSTEYVEEDSLRLLRGAIAYLNQDGTVGGPNFGGGGSPSLRATLRSVVQAIDDPSGQGSVYDVWRRNARVADAAEPPMGDPGGGSDFAGFYNHLGIPHADWGFGGAGGVYHSMYDSRHWMETFGDSGYRYHATAARIAASMVLRLANADILPYDYVEFARTMRRYLPAVDSALAARRWSMTGGPLGAAIERMEQRARAFVAARDSALGRALPSRTRRAANAALMRVERALTRPEGLRTRPWVRGLVYAADENNGYATMVFPSVNEAIRVGDAALVQREMDDLVRRFDAAGAALDDARQALSR
jgi:N-acetylated-alpha-linked acidic dipeptidase